jgi:hypothetical protein
MLRQLEFYLAYYVVTLGVPGVVIGFFVAYVYVKDRYKRM